MRLLSVKHLLSDAGKLPEKLLLNIITETSAPLAQRSDGNSPESRLSSTSTFHSCECFPSSGGRPPDSLLLKRRRSVSDGSKPMFAGISPENRFKYINRKERLLIPPNSSGILPVN
ncbi:hypothetical protein IEQ34_017467 [Dendrobium chrysotoxum]|uniref:Uncharacterized protein n=1 Tax=Dendrobium chrysotoxum TaxID=161865 RepID=A0AAV7GBJ7_DENCH|nr:hypothetical protein IEQ34_017467 [Dendrobium chrysotoxum]